MSLHLASRSGNQTNLLRPRPVSLAPGARQATFTPMPRLVPRQVPGIRSQGPYKDAPAKYEDAVRSITQEAVDDYTVKRLAALVAGNRLSTGKVDDISARLFPSWSWPLYALGVRQLAIWNHWSTPFLGQDVLKELLPYVSLGWSVLAVLLNELNKNRKEDEEDEAHMLRVYLRRNGKVSTKVVPLYAVSTGTSMDTYHTVKQKIAFQFGVDAQEAEGKLCDVGKEPTADSEHEEVFIPPKGRSWRKVLKGVKGILLDLPAANNS